MKTLIIAAAFSLLWIAWDLGKPEESQVKPWSKDFWIISALLALSAYMVSHVDNWAD